MSTQTVSNAVAQRREDRTAIDFMWSKRSHLATVLPKSVDVETFLGTAAGALYANKTLMEYAIGNVDSLFVALLDCAALGHMPGTDEYYLTPRKDKGRGKVLGIEGYRGVIERMYRSGAISKVVVREVCANDRFRYIEGVDGKPVHSFGGDGETGDAFFGAMSKRGAMVGGYAYAEFVTGAVSRVVILTRDDIHAARAAGGWKSAADEFSPWNRLDGGPNHPEFTGRSMWWKTLAKRLEPWVPTSAEYRRESLRASASAAEHAISRRDLPELPAARAVDTGTGEIVDAEIVDTPDVPPAGAAEPPVPAASAAPTPAAPAGGTRPPQPASSGQVGLIQRQFERLAMGGDDQRDARLRVVSRLAGRLVASSKELTSDEARKVRDTLEGLAEPVDLAALLDELALADDPREDGENGE